MRTNLTVLLALISVLLFSLSPSFVNSQNTSNGSLTSQVRQVEGFTGISLDLSGDLSISQGNEFYVEVSAKPDIVDQIVTEKQNSTLIIKYKNSKTVHMGDQPVKITVKLPKLTSLKVNGSGNVTAQTDFTSDKLSIQVNGSGDVDMKNISATSLSVQINGSGDIAHVAGSASDIDVQVNGSGSMNGDGLTGKSVSADISGSGDVTIGVSDALDVEIAGSGDVNYKGNPSSVKKSIVGSGDVNHR